jgi:HK97 family phage major capsid protein
MADKTPAEIVMEAVNELRTTNEANEQKRDALLEDKLRRVNTTLDGFEQMNANLTNALNVQKAMQTQLDNFEKAMNRALLPGLGGNGDAAKALEIRNGFEHFLRKSPEARDRNAMVAFQEYHNTLVKSSDAGAGYLLAPAEVQRQILKDVIEMSPFRGLATVRQIGGDSLKQPKRTAAAGAARRIGETETRVNTGDPAYGILTWNAPELFARAEISQQMLEDSDYDLLGELQDEFSEQFAVKEGTEYVVGSGANLQCEGFMTASGVQEVVSGDASKITGDGLMRLFYGLKPIYARNASWVLKRASLAEIRILKDANNVYIWQPGLQNGQPNQILGASYSEMPDMPAIAANSYPVAFGDWKKAYVIVDRIGLSMQTDYTTGADNGIVIIRARRRVGGGVKQAEAFGKLKIST